MTAIRRRFRSLAWVAIVAMFGLAIGPSISRALAADASGTMAMGMTCLGMGHEHMAMRMHGSSLPQPGTPAHAPDSLDCCALCAVASTPLAAVGFFVPEMGVVAIASVAPLERAAAPPWHRELWSTAVPRGPPSFA